MKPLSGKIALITGSARGLGLAFAHDLAAQGAAVVLSDLQAPHEAAQTLQQEGVKAWAVALDVSSASSVDAAFDFIDTQVGGLDILVNNAGIFTSLKPQSIHDIDMDEWDAVMAVNVRGVFLCSRAAAKRMAIKGYGKIVNIASGTAFKGTPLFAHYVASKGAVIALTRALSKELGADGIRVNAVAAGLVMTDNVLANADIVGRLLQGSLESRALSRAQQPDDVTGAVGFLSGPQSDFITGQTLVVDGGSVTH